MPTIPDRHALGRITVEGADRPNEINPMVAYDIGRAGAAWDKALGEVSSIFGRIATNKQKVDDDTWLAERKIETLRQADAMQRDIEMNAAEDGTGFEKVEPQFKGIVEGQEAVPGGSEEARTKYKLWSSEQAYQTGKWGAANAQARLKNSTLQRLDKRIDEAINLTNGNPEKASEYLSAVEEETKALVGTAIDAPSAQSRIERARKSILKTSVTAKIKREGGTTDFARALKALDDTGLTNQDESKAIQPGSSAAVSMRLETGQTDPLKGVAQIARDAGNSRSYGNFGINSRGGASSSAQQFVNVYGDKFGLTATPGTEEFNRQWKAAAAKDPQALHEAEMDFYQKNITGDVAGKLSAIGVPNSLARDPRTQAYFSDRLVQYGPASITKHSKRIMAAVTQSGDDPAAFLRAMSEKDLASLKGDFPTALATGTYSARGHQNRVMGRESLSLYGINRDAPSQAVATNTRLKDLPVVAGSIQPAELMSLSPEDYQAVTREFKPYLTAETAEKVKDGAAALYASGTQSVITEEDLKMAEVYAGPKVVKQWREVLDEAQDLHNIEYSAKQMTGAQRREHMAAIRPAADAGPDSDAERQHYERWLKVDANIQKAIKENPIAWFSSQNESGRSAVQAIAASRPEDVKSREKAYDILLELQKQEGLDPKDITLLSKDEAEAMSNKLMSAKYGPEIEQALGELQQRYGRHFNTIWGQMARQGGPNSFLAMPLSTRRGQYALLESYALERDLGNAAGKDTTKADLLRQRAGVKADELSAAVNTEIADLTDSIDPSAFQLREAYRDAVSRVTLHHMITKGKSVEDAAKEAAQDVFRQSVDVVRGTMVPMKELDGVYRRAEINKGLGNAWIAIEQVENQIVAMTERSRHGIVYDRSRYLNQLKSNPKYVPSNDLSGVHVIDPWGGRVMVDTPDGPKPFFLSFDQIRKLGQEGNTFPAQGESAIR